MPFCLVINYLSLRETNYECVQNKRIIDIEALNFHVFDVLQKAIKDIENTNKISTNAAKISTPDTHKYTLCHNDSTVKNTMLEVDTNRVKSMNK